MCFSLEWVEHLLIMLVVIAGVIALFKLLIPFILGQLGGAGAVVMAALNIVFWVVICIFVIIVVFDLIACLLGMNLSLFPMRK